jgi:hypothetical protein
MPCVREKHAAGGAAPNRIPSRVRAARPRKGRKRNGGGLVVVAGSCWERKKQRVIHKFIRITLRNPPRRRANNRLSGARADQVIFRRLLEKVVTRICARVRAINPPNLIRNGPGASSCFLFFSKTGPGASAFPHRGHLASRSLSRHDDERAELVTAMPLLLLARRRR